MGLPRSRDWDKNFANDLLESIQEEEIKEAKGEEKSGKGNKAVLSRNPLVSLEHEWHQTVNPDSDRGP